MVIMDSDRFRIKTVENGKSKNFTEELINTELINKVRASLVN